MDNYHECTWGSVPERKTPEFLRTRCCVLICSVEQGQQPIHASAREVRRGTWHAGFTAHSVTAIPRIPDCPSVPRTLLHCGADELADQCQELLRVPGVKLLQQGEQSQDEWWPIHRVGRLPADHSCKG